MTRTFVSTGRGANQGAPQESGLKLLEARTGGLTRRGRLQREGSEYSCSARCVVACKHHIYLELLIAPSGSPGAVRERVQAPHFPMANAGLYRLIRQSHPYVFR
jgi:hypothetical protein